MPLSAVGAISALPLPHAIILPPWFFLLSFSWCPCCLSLSVLFPVSVAVIYPMLRLLCLPLCLGRPIGACPALRCNLGGGLPPGVRSVPARFPSWCWVCLAPVASVGCMRLSCLPPLSVVPSPRASRGGPGKGY